MEETIIIHLYIKNIIRDLCVLFIMRYFNNYYEFPGGPLHVGVEIYHYTAIETDFKL